MHIDAALSLSQPRSQNLVPVSRHDAFEIAGMSIESARSVLGDDVL